MAEKIPSQSDARLREALAAGDPEAFRELVDRCGAPLFAVARRILGNEEDARDAVQDAYVSALRAIGRFDGRSSVFTWLYRITVNAALMRLRKRRRTPEVSLEALASDAGPPEPEWREEASERLDRREVLERIHEGIRSLPEPYRQVLELRVLGGRDTRGTARSLGISAQAVKTRLHRARHALRTLLEPGAA